MKQKFPNEVRMNKRVLLNHELTKNMKQKVLEKTETYRKQHKKTKTKNEKQVLRQKHTKDNQVPIWLS